MGLGYGRFDGWWISFYLFALPSPTGRGVGVRACTHKSSLCSVTWDRPSALNHCECETLTPVPSPMGRGESPCPRYPRRSAERGPHRTLRHKVPDRLTPSGMTELWFFLSRRLWCRPCLPQRPALIVCGRFDGSSPLRAAVRQISRGNLDLTRQTARSRYWKRFGEPERAPKRF
jgi:hypothetical protein